MRSEVASTSRLAPRVSRRELFRGSAAIGFGALLAACGQEMGNRSPVPGISATAAATDVIIVSTRLPSSTPARATAANPVAFVSRIDHDLRYPTALATDRQGNVYVIDADHHRVQKFDGRGTFLTMWGSIGDSKGEFAFRISGPIPGGIAVDERGTVYVSDYFDRVQAFDGNGKFLLEWGSHGAGAGQFDFPTGMATDRQGMIYVCDAGNHRVQKFDRAGHVLLQWGREGNSDGEFVYPSGIAVNQRNQVIVSDADNSRAQVFDDTGHFLSSWGNTSGGVSGIQPECQPGIAVDAQDNVYVVRNNSDRIDTFDRTGRLLTAWGKTGTADGAFIYPSGIAVDHQGNVYISDVIGGRIQKFRPG
jgi:tripartite motif-containing protein 71